MSETVPTPVPENSQRLSGWKEIARYLGRGTRTVQRWEKDHGLPVRRIAGKGGPAESVFAFAAELDGWLQTAAATRARASNDRDESNGHDAVDDTEPPGPPAPQVEASASALAAGNGRPERRGWLRPAVGVLGAAIIVAVALWYIHASRGGAPLERAGAPVSARIDGQALVAADATGADLWRYEVPFPIHQPAAARTDEGAAQSVFALVDIDGDNLVEILVNARPTTVGEPDAPPGLYCLNANGTLRWVYRATRDVVFGDERYGGPFLPYRFFVTVAPENPGRRAVWAVSIHGQMFPALLQRIDPLKGGGSGEYWSNGYIDALRLSRIGSRHVMLVGACNNESKGASLAVLDASSFSGSAPAVKPKYRCADCPAGTPLEFLVFPKPRRFATIDASSSVIRLEVGTADIAVGVQHAHASLPGALALVFYRLTPDLKPLSADTADGYLAVSDALARAGLIAPIDSNGDEPDGEFFPLQRWNGTAFVPLPRSPQH